jgi:predicted  nucleic acid-binding Zn-ribbon protein
MTSKNTVVQMINHLAEQTEDLLALEAEIASLRKVLSRIETRRSNLKWEISQTEATLKEMRDAQNSG